MNPKFRITNRDGKKSLWVNNRNIWDLEAKVLTKDVKQAIISAYYIGMQDMHDKMKEIEIFNRFCNEFEEE